MPGLTTRATPGRGGGATHGPSIRDLQAGRTAPERLPYAGRRIGSSPSQNEMVQTYARWAESLGAQDIRINQAQVNAGGWKVSNLRPDLQFTLNGQRHYVEFDTVSSLRGAAHREGLMNFDPHANVFLVTE